MTARRCTAFVFMLTMLGSGRTVGAQAGGDARQDRFDAEARLMSWGSTSARPGSSAGIATDLFIRRARLVVQARVTGRLTLTAQLGQDNIGATVLAPDGGIAIKDAYAGYRAHAALQLAAGQFKVPFLRANLESGFNQVLVDRGTLPALRPAREGSRDLGVMAWGNARRLQYRVALFDGSDQDAAASGPRVTARIAHNWFAAETAFGYTGSYLGTTRVLQVAAQADVQTSRTDRRDDTAFRTLRRDYRAWAVEAFTEQPFGAWAITADTAWLDRRDDYENPAVPTRAVRGYYVQTGLLLPPVTGPGRVQVAVRREDWTSDRRAAEAVTTRTTAGLTYYLRGHSRKVQADYTVKRETPEVRNDELRISLVLVL